MGNPGIASPSAAERDGLRIARLFRQARGLTESRPCDLEAILATDDIEVAESALSDPGYTACLIRRLDPPGGGIVLAPGQNSGRRRFSIAHELGHFHIPRHRSAGDLLQCLEPDLRARSQDVKRIEWEANDFATEVLMPARLFRVDARDRDISFRSVYELASPAMYDVSVTAAAWRVVQTSREACALVVCQAGRIAWVVRSSSFPFLILEKGQAPQPTTHAAAVLRGETVNEDPRAVEAFSWIDGPAVAQCDPFESTHLIPKLDQVLSLLWIPDVEATGKEDD